jgi:hypothetical protein
MNTVVLPPLGPDEPILVYLLAPQPAANVYPMGGHYRFEVGSDGRVGGRRAFAKSCLAMPARLEGKPEPVALTVSHLLDPVPTELHVFTSYAVRKPLFVAVPKPERVWVVRGDQIRLPKP